MRNTIKAKQGFYVVFEESEMLGEKITFGILVDGTTRKLRAEIRTMADYKDEVVNGNNECAYKVGVLTTKNGEQFILWTDYEIEEFYLTEVAG